MYADYKGTRGETKPELKAQFSLAQEVLKEMGISQFVLDGFEADDIIGTLAKKLKGEIPVYILTKDQDALQLVDETIRLWYMTSKAERAGEMYKELGMDIKQFNLPDGVFEFNPMYVEHFYGVKPIQIIDRKAIEGDTSDNIPGVKGVGEASVVPLLQEFGTMEDIYDFIESNDEDTIKDMFKSLGIKRSPLSLLTKTSDTELVGKEAAELSKKLATINLEIGALQGITVEQLALGIDEVGQRRVFERFAFKSLLEEAQKVTA
jgi:5'-3' exonuclease